MSILTNALATQAAEAIRQAGALLADPDAVHTVTPKSRTDFVTNVDLIVQNTLRGQLERLAPAVQFLGKRGKKLLLTPAVPSGFWTR